jgi:6-pyruvoyltetrahydropterin/6-carboxytetrahydropterin synthase
MHLIEVAVTFAAAHALRLPAAMGGGLEPVHGHNFHLTVQLASDALDALETVVDFHDIERLLAGIVGPWTNRHLNEIEPFASRVNPSAERIAEEVGRRLTAAVGDGRGRGLRVTEVRLTEAPGCLAIWRP